MQHAEMHCHTRSATDACLGAGHYEENLIPAGAAPPESSMSLWLRPLAFLKRNPKSYLTLVEASSLQLLSGLEAFPCLKL